MKFRTTAGIALATAATVVTAACSTAPAQSPVGGGLASGNGPVKAHPITWLFARPSNGPVIEAVKEVADAYAKLHPGFKLNLITVPSRPAYLQKVETLAAANQLPQLFDEDATPFAQSLASEGRLVNTGDLLKEFGDTSQFRPLALQYQRFDDGSLYAIPLEFAMEFFFYNKAAFRQAGITPPTTLSQLAADCAPLRAKGYVPIALDGQDGWPLERYLAYYPFRLTGEKFVNQLKRGETTLTTPTGQAATGFIAGLGKQGCFDSGFSATSYTDAVNLFTTGKAAILNDGTWDLGTLASTSLPASMRGNISFFKLPAVPGAATTQGDYVVSSGIGMAVNAATFDPLVKSFLKYLLANYPAKYAALGQIPAMTGVTVKAPAGSTPLYGQALAQANQLGTLTAKPWDTLLDPASNTKVQQDLVLLAQGNMSPSSFASDVDTSITQNAPKYFPKTGG